jgi:hypothetical protein
MHRRLTILCFLCVSVSLWFNPLVAAEPQLRNLNLRGLQVGGTTTLVVDGEGLGPSARLLVPCVARQQLKKGTTDKQATFEITLDGQVVPGLYPLFVVTEHGVSQPVVIAVDRLPQRPLSAAVEQLPVALHGTVGGSAVVETRFAGKAGQKVRVEVEAQRLGSKLRPILHLYGPRRLQVAWAWGKPRLSGDARLDATLPDDGTYTVTVHDAEYAVPGPAFFRLKLGQWASVAQVFPPVVARGKPQALELLGPSPLPFNLGPQLVPGVTPVPWPGDGVWSGPRPFVYVSPHPEVVAQTSAAKVQELPAGPVGVSGRLRTPYQEDRFRVPVTPKSKLRLEVFADRYGSPLDVTLLVRNDKGDVLSRAEESPGTVDPVLEYAVPDQVHSLLVGVVDASGRGGPLGVYRLTIDPKPPAPGTADFRLYTPDTHLTLPAGGRGVVPVLVERRGHAGSVELAASGLPAGVRLEGTTIPEGADGTLVTVHGSSGGAAVFTNWRGRAGSEERAVTVKGHPLERLQPWLATDIPVAPATAPAAEFQIDWRGLPSDLGIVPARKLTLPVKVKRADEKAGVRLTLLTSQRVPAVNGQPDQNQALRSEKAIELAAKATDADVIVLVPPQLASPVYDVTVRAELLTPDKKTKAVVYAPVRRLAVRLPVVVHLDGPARIETALDAKKETTVKIAGKVERREGLTGDVALSLTGLPPGTRADAPTVKAGATAFTLNVILPPNLAPGEVSGLKLAGSATPDAKQPGVRVRSREVELTLIVKAAGR